MRSLILFCALLIGVGPGQSLAATAVPPETGSSIDHILLWGRDIDRTTAVLTVKLGLQVRPGRNPGGVANRYVRMADRSYIELLGITRPHPTMDPGMQADQDALHGDPGSRTFGLRSPTLDRTRSVLQQQGMETTGIFAAAPTDPDGGGPTAPPRWRLFAFNRQPLSSNLFFIDYAAPDASPASVADDRAAREHPVGAREVSALWLLSSDAAADRRQFERMGYPGATAVRIAQIAARGYAVPVGKKRVYVLQPDGAGIAADALRKGGPRIIGVSVGVADLAAAKRRVERGYETQLTSYRGVSGESFLAPTQDDLGLLIEFHAMPGTAVASVPHRVR